MKQFFIYLILDYDNDEFILEGYFVDKAANLTAQYIADKMRAKKISRYLFFSYVDNSSFASFLLTLLHDQLKLGVRMGNATRSALLYLKHKAFLCDGWCYDYEQTGKALKQDIDELINKDA